MKPVWCTTNDMDLPRIPILKAVELRVFKLQKKNGKGTTAERINIFTGADKGAAADVLHRLTSERFAIPVPITNSGLDCRWSEINVWNMYR